MKKTIKRRGQKSMRVVADHVKLSKKIETGIVWRLKFSRELLCSLGVYTFKGENYESLLP
jgi:hypothetical protein